MKSVLKPLLLLSFIVVAATYTYANVFDIETYKYWLKPFLMPLLASYYLVIAKIVDRKFLVALFFAFCGDLFFLSHKESMFILGMSSFLVFILINMIIISSRIGEIKLARFYLIILPFILMTMGIISTFFGDVGLMKLLFIIYASVLGLYGAFAVYWYLKEKNKWTLLNLIGVFLFFLAAIGKGLKIVEVLSVNHKIINMAIYITAMLLICISYAHHTNHGKKHLKLKKHQHIKS